MTSAKNRIDLSQLPPPTVVEEIDYEDLLETRKQELISRYPEAADYLQYESDPMVKLLEENAYLETLLRQRINDAAVSVMLAYASSSDLDNLSAFFGVERLILEPEDRSTVPPTPAVLESDTRLRERTQLALDGFSTAGPAGAYLFHALSASPLVKDVSVNAPKFEYAELSPEVEASLPAGAIVLIATDDAGLSTPVPGDVAVTILSTDGTGTPEQDLIDTVMTSLDDEDVRPLTDNPRYLPVELVDYTLEATIYVKPGVEGQAVMSAVELSADSFIEDQKILGSDLAISAVYKALHLSGVARVDLASPASDVAIAAFQAPHCTSIQLHYGGVEDE